MQKSTVMVGGLILVLFLAGAAFVGARLLNGQGLPGVFWGGGNSHGVRIDRDDIQPAQELPQTAADVDEIFDHRQDNRLFVGTGNFAVRVQADTSGKVQTGSHYDGPPPEGQKIQQVLEPGSLDSIGESSGITVWGKNRGDRIIPDALESCL